MRIPSPRSLRFARSFFALSFLLVSSAALGQHVAGLAINVSCPTSVASGAAFNCTFSIQNLDLAHNFINLAATDTFPFPGGAVTSVSCFQAGTTVAVLGPQGTPNDTCTGTLPHTAPTNSGSTSVNYQIQVAVSGNDGDSGTFAGLPVTGSTTNIVPVNGTGGGSHTTGLLTTISCPVSVISGAAFNCTYSVRNLDTLHGVENLVASSTSPFPGGSSVPVACQQAGFAVSSLGPSGTAIDSCSGTASGTAPVNCTAAAQLTSIQIAVAGTDADPGTFHGVPITGSVVNSTSVSPNGSGAPGPHTTGLNMTLTCPISVASGDTFQCSFQIRNFDTQHEADNLSLASTFPFPGGTAVPSACFRGAVPVTTLGWMGSPTDSCTGTVAATAPVNCGAADQVFVGRLAASAVDACSGTAITGSVDNAVLVPPQACTLPTPPGNDVVADFDDVKTVFSNVSSGGATTISPIDPATAGTLPSGGYALSGLGIGFELTTTATVTGDIIVGIVVPSTVDEVTFNSLRVLHGEGGALVDRTYFSPDGCAPTPTAPCPAPDFATRTIYARVSSLSPFVLATVPNPAVGPITVPTDPVQILTPVNVEASFTDASGTHTAVWAWDDGTTSPGAVTESGGSGTVTGSHTYTAAGVYRVTLTVTDDGGFSGQRVSSFLVVYDPNGGFVTGSGWINSPAGAYAADDELAGKASFGFVSKYPKGANVPPVGETQFQFQAANLRFESMAYEWLVISGAKARYRGTGQINGAGSYGFELTAWDGQVIGGGGADRFRIKIWNENQGNAVVYDNQMGAADGADPTTALGGGSIVIHKK
jgi:hypothetical protein